MDHTVQAVGEARAEIHHPLCQLRVGLLEVQHNGLLVLEALGKGLGPLVEAGWLQHIYLVVRIEKVTERGFWGRESLFLLRMLKPRRQLLERQRVTYLFLRFPRSPVGVSEYYMIIWQSRNRLRVK
jgi:hypothetical protein